jgi:hypothetical protein
MTPTIRRFSETGRGGFVEMVVAATGRSPNAAFASTAAIPSTSHFAGLDFASLALEGSGWSVALTSAGRTIRWRGASASLPPLLDPFDAFAPWRAPEPAALELSTRDLERLAKTGAIAIEGDAGTYKLAFELEWPGAPAGDAEDPRANAFAYRVENGEGEVVGWMAVGAAMPRATFPLRVSKLERRPLALRVVRVDAATGGDLPWSGAALRRAWLAALGSQFWVCRAGEEAATSADPKTATAREVMARPLRGGKLEMELAWTLRADSPALGVELVWRRAGTEPWPSLSLGTSGGYERSTRLAPTELAAMAPLAELGAAPAADGLRLVARGASRAEESRTLLLLSDEPLEFPGVEGDRSFAPKRSGGRFAFLPE